MAQDFILPVKDPRLVVLWRHRLAARNGHAMPSRTAIDPTAMPSVLPPPDWMPDARE